METIYNIIQQNPKFFAWAFGLVNVLWGVFTYFNKQSHDKKMEQLKHSLSLDRDKQKMLWEKEITKIIELENLAGEAKEIATSYNTVQYKNERFGPIYEKLSQLAGQFSQYPALMQAIRDLNHYCAILIDAQKHNENHESYRSQILDFYSVLINECKQLKNCTET